MSPMRDVRTTTNDEQGKIELLSQWMLDGCVSQNAIDTVREMQFFEVWPDLHMRELT